jgi:nucleotide-binding universal stress UspA family protein/MFS family permease
MRQGPLAGRYVAVASMVLFALIPYLALSAALSPLSPIISSDLHMSAQTLSLGSGLGNAAYAVGTVLAVQFAQHLPQRRMLVVYAVLLLIGSLLSAAAQSSGMFIAGHIIQGLCTSLLLIAAVPPLAIGYPKDKLRDTAVIMNMCIFGAVALGPFIGGLQAHANAWRPLFWIVAGISAVAVVLSILTFEDSPPANPDSPTDLLAIALAAVGCVAAFYGAAELTSHPFLSVQTIVPLLVGLGLIVTLVVYQYRAKQPLLTIKTMLVSSIPVAGIVVALFAAAASVSATALTAGALLQVYNPLHVGLLFLPEVGGAVLTAFILGNVITKKAMHYLPLVGMISLAAGIVVFRIDVPASNGVALVASALTGFGLGATVAPALFVAGFSLPSANLQRVFAIVELLRAVAAFMIAPIFVHFAATVGGSLDAGTGYALWIGLALAVIGTVAGVGIYALSGARPQKPDLDGFLAGLHPAWFSPPLLAKFRGVSYAIPATERIVGVPTAEPATVAPAPSTGPVVFAYDGSDLAKLAIEQAGSQLAPGRDALIVCVWQPGDVGFVPVNGNIINAAEATEVRAAAEETAERGALLAQQAGFRSQSLIVEAAPTWSGIVQVAEHHSSPLIVLGSHHRDGVAGRLLGSVAAAVMQHTSASVLVIHESDSD